MYNIITKKKHGEALTKDEIEYVINGYTKGEIPDYQMSALLMAIVLNKMNKEETYNLTMAMTNSGDTLDYKIPGKVTADKHSTGGVGDKTSLIVGPICAACGVAIAKMSGKGLGHTGGTIDKLNSIPGFMTEISEEEFINIVTTSGLSIISQTADLAPADKKIYALRDVTATVDNISLIASSIMSKKLAAGSEVIVLDVKCGSGAFMKELPDAIDLANEMVDIGRSAGRKMFALLSDMNQPLGRYVGNKLEVMEAVKTLRGEGEPDLLEACLHLSSLILVGAGIAKDFDEGIAIAKNTLDSGMAYEAFKTFVKAQHGDISFLEDIDAFAEGVVKYEVKAHTTGYVSAIDTEMIGMASLYLGGGRVTKEDIIEPNVGLYINAKVDDYINEGDVLATLYYKEDSDYSKAKQAILDAYVISNGQNRMSKHGHSFGYIDDNGYHQL